VSSDPDQLAAELAREKEEVLRLRGLLITRDGELGAARGRLMVLEDRAQRLLGRARKLLALLPSRG
jgi:hypothetical protein